MHQYINLNIYFCRKQYIYILFFFTVHTAFTYNINIEWYTAVKSVLYIFAVKDKLFSLMCGTGWSGFIFKPPKKADEKPVWAGNAWEMRASLHVKLHRHDRRRKSGGWAEGLRVIWRHCCTLIQIKSCLRLNVLCNLALKQAKLERSRVTNDRIKTQQIRPWAHWSLTLTECSSCTTR